ncbi:transglycosylase domain-containing protein [Glycomyces sp. A-F 0318]|uniref:transglycosylase domain-containing protein n=1 Tax=Glycomyces amatae TaxID=2881355 RepID=UPI001E56F6C1|nr:transglycosylase domain-containing protein [Glycomyces amatae]MCD0442097.1 transglycosylase domain-containing protein [Glycomyces amatae]
MSDYGYRPAPPPEDGRPGGGGQQGGRSYGGASRSAGSGQPDYGWGGQQGGGAPRPRPQQQYGTPASGSAAVGRGSASVGGSGRASVGGASGSASVGGPGRSGRASVGSASVGSASVGSASVGSASVGSASVGSASVGTSRPPGREDTRTSRPGAGGRRRAGKGPVDGEDGKKRKRLGRKMFATLIALAVLFVGAVTVTGAIFLQNTPPLSGVFRQGESSAFYYADGTTQAGAYGDTLRLQVEPGDVPETVTDALVALEDRKFWDHGGVDYVGTMRALINNVTGGDTQGASTITQQYAGMVLDARDEMSYDRKAREAAMAMKMESEYDKEEIITAYLNMAYFGRGAYGIEAAAKNYFGIELKDVTIEQAAFMVMQVKSPNGYYDPYYTDAYNEEAAQGRWNFTMDALVETGQLPQSERDALEYPTPIDEFNSSGSWGGNTDIGFIINELDGYVFDELWTRYGISKEELSGGEDNPNGGGYSVTLTIDPNIQNALKTTGSRGDVKVERNENGEPVDKDGNVVTDLSDAEKVLTDEGYAQFVNSNEDAALVDYDPYMMTAMVAIDPETGAIVGYYGGDNGFGVDKAGAESPHPPSSTFKMVTAATALDQGDSTQTWFNADSPRPFESLTLDDTESCIGGGDYPDCTLRNGNQGYPLELTLTDAVRKSKNTPMYAISEHYGANAILDLADRMGLSVMNQARQIEDDNGEMHDVSVNYVMQDDGTYTQHGRAVDAENNSIVDASGNWDVYADIQVDENCNPIINTDGLFLAAEESTPCEIGGKNETDPFYHHLSFGQYPTSVRDMASIYATIANNGVYHESHFVAEVKNSSGEVVEPVEELTAEQVISEETARNLQWIGSEIAGETDAEKLDRDYFGKTGTWEAAGEDKDGNEYPDSYNAHAWYVGAIPQLSIAAWVGNVTSESDPIANDQGDKTAVFGSNTAYPVWLSAIKRVLDAEDWDAEEWDGKVDSQGNKTYWDIEAAGGPRDGGEFCAANADNELCAGQQEEQAQEDCEADGGTWDGETCQPGENEDDDNGTDQPTTDPTTDPTDDEGGEEDCGGFMQPPCDDPTTDGPTTEAGESPDGPDGNNR